MSTDRVKITIYDVADRAGVAISTVSRVLNGSPDVSRSTKAAVERAIKELKYRPDRTAKALAQQRYHMLAVAIPTFTTPFHNALLKGIRSALQGSDMDLLLSDLGSKKRAYSLLEFLRRGAVDGLLLAGVQVDAGLALELQALHAPVVLIGSHWDSFDGYRWDESSGARKAVEHLIESGHSRIGMIRTQRDSRIQLLRVEGYKTALMSAGITYEESLVVSGDTEKHAGFSEEAGYEGMLKLLAHPDPPTAVFASSDVQAIGAWEATRQRGLSVPEDMALVGYDDIKMSKFLGLTSVDQSMQEIGTSATRLLLDRLSGDNMDEPRSIIVEPVLQIRRSSLKT
jgi:LacI family transcriptional regulator, galactose operon repressor